MKSWIYSGTGIAFLFLCLIAVNVAAYFVPLRIDITEDKLYTISEGSKKILGDLEKPVTLKFFFSEGNKNLPPVFKNYAQRVREFLKEYSDLSKGKLSIEILNPQPDTDEESLAQKHGVSRIALPDGTPIFFGAVMILDDREEVIPYFDLRREEFLEYDVSRALLKLSQGSLSKVGLLTSLPMTGAAGFPGQAPAEKWVLLSELEKTMTVENLALDIKKIPDDIDLLMLIHPKLLSDSLLYAVDQYVLGGGRLIVMLDPNARVDMASPANKFSQQPQISSDLPKLLKAWGVGYDVSKVVGDLKSATPVRTPEGTVRYPLWMSFTADTFNKKNPVTSQLEQVLFIEPGSFVKLPGSNLNFQPLISTSISSGTTESFLLRFVKPDQVLREFKVDNQSMHLMVSLSGLFQTAFPDGVPVSANTDNSTPDQDTPHPAALKVSAKANTVILIADVDFISDSYSVQKRNFLGQTIVQPLNDNQNLMMNAVEYLSGNSDLMSIRSRGRFSRPFTRVIAMQEQAQALYQEEERILQGTLTEIQTQLEELLKQSKGKDKTKLPAEIQKQVEQFQERELQTRKKLREVRKILRQDIEALGSRLLVLNLLLLPLLVGIAGLVSYRSRTRKQRDSS